MYVGIGAGALVLVIVVAVIATSGGGTQKQEQSVAYDGSADGLMREARGLLSKAQNMPATPAYRNTVYQQVVRVGEQAKRKFESSGQHSKVIEANKLVVLFRPENDHELGVLMRLAVPAVKSLNDLLPVSGFHVGVCPELLVSETVKV